jgi:hypothetical protein
MMQQTINSPHTNTQPLMQVFADRNGFVREIQVGEFFLERDEVSAAFGHPMMTSFERIFGENGERLSTYQRPDKGEVSKIHQMSYRPAGSNTWTSVTAQQIIDRVIQYRIEEELKMQDALEDILFAQIENNPIQDNEVSLSEDDIILSTGESFSDFSARVGNDVHIEIVKNISDADINHGLDQAEKNRLEIEERAKVNPQDARGLQGYLKESFPKNIPAFGDNLLQKIQKLSFKQAKIFEATLMASVLTTQFSQTTMEITPDAVTVTSLADVNAQAEQQAKTEAQAEQQRCMQSITSEQMIDMRVDLFEQSQFYQDRIHSPTYSERARVIWVRMVADAVKEVWERDSALMMHHGYRDMDHLFRTQIFIAYAESKGNEYKLNSANPLVAGMHHISIRTARSIIEKYNLRDRYPDVFPDRQLQRSDLNRARVSAILYSYISADDHRYLSQRLGENVSEAFPQYHPYIPHVNGGPVAYRLIEAAMEQPTKLDRRSGRQVLKTAVDIVGTRVARDNPSLYYRTVNIYHGNEVTTAYIATLPDKAARQVREKRVARSVNESINILNQRGQNQEGIESIGHPTQERVQQAAELKCLAA